MRILPPQVLVVNNNRLVSLPEEIGRLSGLEELDASCNEITHLPVQIGDLQQMRSLNLRRNHLQEVPIGKSELFPLLDQMPLKDAYLWHFPLLSCEQKTRDKWQETCERTFEKEVCDEMTYHASIDHFPTIHV